MIFFSLLVNTIPNPYQESRKKKQRYSIHTFTSIYNNKTPAFFLKMAIYFMNTSPSTITLPPTSLNQAHHTQQSSPFLEPLLLSRSQNIASLFREQNNNQHQIIKLTFIGTVFHPSNQRQRQIQSIDIIRR